MTTKSASFDELDRKMVAALTANARTSFNEIGAAIGLSATAVKRRVDRMWEDGVITGFTTTVKPATLGWRTEVKLPRTRATPKACGHRIAGQAGGGCEISGMSGSPSSGRCCAWAASWFTQAPAAGARQGRSPFRP